MSSSNRIPSAGDNGNDMRASWSVEDTEKVLRGHTPVSADAARLGPAIAALRARAHGTVNAAAVAAMAPILAEAARESVTGAVPTRGRPARLAAPRSAAPWRRRVALTGVVTVFASAGLVGTAAAADGAAPGDSLYSVDRAFEAVGIGAGGSRERLGEAERLVDEGRVGDALHHAADALQGEGDDSSSAALIAAADQLAADGTEGSAEVHARVAEMFRWMSEADLKGSEFGQTVNAYARGLGASRSNAADDSGTPGKSGDDTTSNDGGKAQDVPDSPGESGEAGQPKQGNQDAATPSGASQGRPGNGNGG